MLLIDIDTQVDFMVPAGALYVPGAERLLPLLRRIFQAAGERGIMVLSSVDAHAENDPEFASWPPHCVAGTLGQQKISETLLQDRAVIPNPGGAAFDGGRRQLIFEKQALDVFTNPNFGILLERHQERECAVVGVATEYCVRFAVEGLLRAGRKVRILTDAVSGINGADSDRVLAAAAAGGAELTTAAAMGF